MVKPALRPGGTEVIKEQIASKQNIALLQKTLHNVVETGLGRKAALDTVSVAGMMSTCKLEPINGVDEEMEYADYHLSFCGYFPADKPRYSIIIDLEKSGLPAAGGGMCGPIFRQIAEYMVNKSNIYGDKNRQL